MKMNINNRLKTRPLANQGVKYLASIGLIPGLLGLPNLALIMPSDSIQV